MFAKLRAFWSFESEKVWSAPAATPFTSAKRSASAPNSSTYSTGLTTLCLDFDIFSVPLRTIPWRYTVRNGTSPMFSRPIMIMRATQKKMMS